jgi:hypothetical protein
MMAHHIVEFLMRGTYIARCESIKTVFMSHYPRARAPTLSLHLIVRSTHLNIPNEVKLWHKAAPLLITAVTILGLIVIFQH